MPVTKEVRTIMYSVVGDTVVTHRFPFDANEVYGRSKLQKLVARGFTFDDPRGKVKTGIPEVIVTQEVDMEKPVDGGGGPADMSDNLESVEGEETPVEAAPPPVKKWKNMNAKERKAYQLAKKGAANA